MRKARVLKYFGGVAGVREAIERVGGTISRAAIYQWPDVIPLERAFELERASNGELAVNLALYRQRSAAR